MLMEFPQNTPAKGNGIPRNFTDKGQEDSNEEINIGAL